MHIINITVRNKIAVNPAQDRYVCGNSDFVVHFDFDSEWDAYETKTARFVKEDGSYVDQLFDGSECPVPVISDTYKLQVGVFAGNLSTTTAAYVPCKKSILCGAGSPADPAPDVYNQIMARLQAVAPEATEPHTQLVTDKDGNAVWVERLAWKEVTTQKGYVYVYQDATSTNADGMYLLPDAPAASPVAGETYAIIINGTEYTCKCVDVSETVGATAYAFGNATAMGDDIPFENPDPDATYFIMLVPFGMDGVYGIMFLMEDNPPESVTLTIRSVEEVETTTTNIKKVDRELLDLPTQDWDATEGEEGFIANRPCWAYEVPDGWIVWDGVTEGKETLTFTLNGATTFLGYKVCPVPMNLYSFNKGNAFYTTFVYDSEGTSKASAIVQKMEMFMTPGLYALSASDGATKYFSYNKDEVGNATAEISGSSGIYIAADFAAQYPRVDLPVKAIYKPIDAELLSPPSSLNGVHYYRWSPGSKEWKAVTIDQIKADLGFYTVEATYDGSTATVTSGTYAEAFAAAQAGGHVRVKLSQATATEVYYLPMMMYSDTMIQFAATNDAGTVCVSYTADGLTVTVTAID